MVLLSIGPTTVTLSTVLGYTSITCWLGAQFPQIIANWRNESVEGLALPFLANWLFGDITNLVGCILTDQLDFQKYLATYFCFVDICLVSQYVYYSDLFGSKASEMEGSVTAQSPLVSSRIASSPQVRYRAIHQQAANIAAAAEYAALEYDQQFEESPTLPSSSERRAASLSVVSREYGYLPRSASAIQSRHATTGSSIPRGARTAPIRPRELEDEDEEADQVPEMQDSLVSEEGRARSAQRQRRPVFNMTASTTSIASDTTEEPGDPSQPGSSRGRPTERRPLPPIQTVFDPFDEQTPVHRRALSAALTPGGTWTHSRERSTVSRRSATIVFMGVWTLFTVGGWSSAPVGSSRIMHPDVSADRLGKVLGEMVVPFPGHDPPTFGDVLPQIPPSSLAAATPIYISEGDTTNTPSRPNLPNPKPPKHPPRSMTIIIGRISAWLCTLLYLTSRLPQIWKNFVRKSVEGLSMTLFVAAFCGNLFYVLSILTNPLMNAPEETKMDYIRETMPYLLGSGGTLLFDITIVTQSFIYRGRRPRPMRAASFYTGSTLRARSLPRRRTFGEDERLLVTASSSRPATLGKRSRSRVDYGAVASEA